jgi:hypothetical protein
VIWKPPVAVAHVGCLPAVGAAGVAGCALTTILDDTAGTLHAFVNKVRSELAVTNPYQICLLRWL